jgi:hypothetical protein
MAKDSGIPVLDLSLKPDWPEYPLEFSLLKNLSFATQPQELHTYSLETISKITV